MPDVEHHEGLPLAEQVVDGPFESSLAAFGEIQRHPDLPIACHWSLALLSPAQRRSREKKDNAFRLIALAFLWVWSSSVGARDKRRAMRKAR